MDTYLATDTLYLIEENSSLNKCQLLTGAKYYKEKNALLDYFKVLRKSKPEFELGISRNLHDRYIIVDQRRVYSFGESIKDAGNKGTIVKVIKNSTEIIDLFNDLWKQSEKVT